MLSTCQVSGKYIGTMENIILGWPDSSFLFFCNILWKTPNKLIGQANTNYDRHRPYLKN